MNLCSAIAINGKALPGFSLVWRYNASEEGRMFTVPLDGSATADRARAYARALARALEIPVELLGHRNRR